MDLPSAQQITQLNTSISKGIKWKKRVKKACQFKELTTDWKVTGCLHANDVTEVLIKISGVEICKRTRICKLLSVNGKCIKYMKKSPDPKHNNSQLMDSQISSRKMKS